MPEAEVKQAEAALEAERRANEAAVAMYKARRVSVIGFVMVVGSGVLVVKPLARLTDRSSIPWCVLCVYI